MDQIDPMSEQLDGQVQGQRDLAPFHHEALDPKRPDAIRLVRINPELKNGLLDCELWDATWRAEYCTLSYVCGNSENMRQILLNGQIYHVRANLWDFLACARGQSADKVFWIDALSIHQGDLDERNHQVQVMSRIYSETEEVHVWLGMDHDDGGFALNRIDTCIEEIETAIEASVLDKSNMIAACFKDEAFWRGFKAIHESLYWNRAWIMQEFVLPSEGRLLMGTGSTSLDNFEAFILRCSNMGDDILSVVASTGRDLWLMRKGRVRSGAIPEIPFLEARACSDIRDRLYSALPFHNWEGSFRVDYLLNPFELLLEYRSNRFNYPIDNTANLLNMTPITIMLYTQPEGEFEFSMYERWCTLPEDAKSLHLRSAASTTTTLEWLQLVDPFTNTASSNRRLWERAYDSMDDRIIKEMLEENRVEFDVVSDNITALKYTASPFYLILAAARRSDETSRKLDDTELPEAKRLMEWSSCCKVSGKYITKCCERPETVYFALLQDPKVDAFPDYRADRGKPRYRKRHRVKDRRTSTRERHRDEGFPLSDSGYG